MQRIQSRIWGILSCAQEQGPDPHMWEPWGYKMTPRPNLEITHHLPRKAQKALNQGHQGEVHSGKVRVRAWWKEKLRYLPLHNGEGGHPDSQRVNVRWLRKGAEEKKGAGQDHAKTWVLDSNRCTDLPSHLRPHAILVQRRLVLYLHFPCRPSLEVSLPIPGCVQVVICRQWQRARHLVECSGAVRRR